MLFLAPLVAEPPHFAPPAIVTRMADPQSGPPAVAVNEGGKTLVAWMGERTRGGARVIVRRGANGAKQVLSGRPAGEPVAALGPDGSAAVMWSRDGEHGRRFLEVAVAPPGGRFGRPQRLVSVVANISAWNVMAAGGRFVAVWWQGVPGHDHAIRYAKTNGARFGALQTLAAVNDCCTVSSAADGAGNVVATWTTPDDGQAAAAALAPGTERFGPVQPVSADTRFLPWYPRAFGGPGGAAVAYGRTLVRLGADGRFGTPVEAAGEDGRSELTTSVTALPQGNQPVLAWSLTRTRNAEDETVVGGRVDATPQQADGSLSEPVALSRNADYPDGGLTGVATRTAAVLLWAHGLRLRYVVHTGQGFAPARTLSIATDAVVMAAAGDHAVAAWLTGRRLRVARLG